ncbi:MAG: endonuclease III [Clostridia bacterium]|nr:endonuclease III [Clostridia bacterium]
MSSAAEVWSVLEKSFGDAKCSLIKDTPYRLAVRGILSAQCTDKRVNFETEKIFREYPDPVDIYKMDFVFLENLIKPCGLSKMKAKSIKEFTAYYMEVWNEQIPRDTDELMRVSGIGRKIANLIVGEVYGIQRIVVDTHLKRVAYRIGLTDETDPLKVEKDLNNIFEENQRIDLGHRMIALGRAYCKAGKPSCSECPMSLVCSKRI